MTFIFTDLSEAVLSLDLLRGAVAHGRHVFRSHSITSDKPIFRL